MCETVGEQYCPFFNIPAISHWGFTKITNDVKVLEN